MSLGKELIETQRQVIEVQQENILLIEALEKLSHKKTVTHKRVPRKNPFRVLRGGKSC